MDKSTFFEITSFIGDKIKGTEFENQVYAVGGSVRDLEMGLEIKDIDLVISLPDGGIRLAQWFEEQRLTNGTVVTYPTYGTAMFKLKEYPDEEIECVQTRKEQYHNINSRNPETSYGTIEEDALRRDLTINALYYNVNTKEIVDPTGRGKEDLERGILRITNPCCDTVLADDPLRILRIIRFYGRFGWEIEGNTWSALLNNSYRIAIITEERIQDELCKILMSEYYYYALVLLKEIQVLQYINPYFFKMEITFQNKYNDGITIWKHTLNVLKQLKNDKIEVRLAALFHDIGKCWKYDVNEQGKRYFKGGSHCDESVEITREIMKSLKFSNQMIDEVCFYIMYHMDTKKWGNELENGKDKDIRKLQYECQGRFYDLLDLIDADNKSASPGHTLPNQVEYIRMRSSLLVKMGKDMFNYKLPINGDDVMKRKQIGPSPKVKKYLDAALKMTFSEPNLTKEELLKRLSF